jgi:hypothetical protein
MKNNHVNTIESAMNKLEALNDESSRNILGGKIHISVKIDIT